MWVFKKSVLDAKPSEIARSRMRVDEKKSKGSLDFDVAEGT